MTKRNSDDQEKATPIGVAVDDYLTVKEVAAILKFSTKTVIRIFQDDPDVYHRRGRVKTTLRIPPHALARHLQKGSRSLLAEWQAR